MASSLTEGIKSIPERAIVLPLFDTARSPSVLQKLLFACKIIALLGYITASCCGYGGKIHGKIVLGAMIGSFIAYTFSSICLGRHKLRKVELLIEITQLFILVVIAAVHFKSVPSRPVSLGTLPILLLSTISMSLQVYQIYDRYKMKKHLSELHRECRSITLEHLAATGPTGSKTTAILVHNSQSLLPFQEIAQPKEEFSVVTFNTALMRKMISIHCNRMRPPAERAKQIADYLRSMPPDALPTHFCLQECFSEEKLLAEVLSELYPTVVCNIAPHPGFGEGSGLIFATRWKGLEKVQFASCYCEPLSEETLVDKGIALFTFKEASGKEIKVGNLHLVSRASRQRREQEFQKQLIPILKSFKGGPCIIAGDYNIPFFDVFFPLETEVGIDCVDNKSRRATFFNIDHPQWKRNTHVNPNPMHSKQDFMDTRQRDAIFDHIGATEEHFEAIGEAEALCLYDSKKDPTPSDHLAIKVVFKRKDSFLL